MGVARRIGRPPVLQDSELLTILIWDGLTEGRRPLKDLYNWIVELPRLLSEAPSLPKLCCTGTP